MADEVFSSKYTSCIIFKQICARYCTTSTWECCRLPVDIKPPYYDLYILNHIDVQAERKGVGIMNEVPYFFLLSAAFLERGKICRSIFAYFICQFLNKEDGLWHTVNWGDFGKNKQTNKQTKPVNDKQMFMVQITNSNICLKWRRI